MDQLTMPIAKQKLQLEVSIILLELKKNNIILTVVYLRICSSKTQTHSRFTTSYPIQSSRFS